MDKKLPFARLGVVGGGQLARMLGSACNNYDVQMTILDPSYNSPAGKVAFDQIEGELDDPVALQLLCERSDIVTFDLENVGTDILVGLADQGIEIVPGPAVISLIQNVFILFQINTNQDPITGLQKTIHVIQDLKRCGMTKIANG